MFILFCFTLFYVVLFCYFMFILFCFMFILFYVVLFYFMLFYVYFIFFMLLYVYFISFVLFYLPVLCRNDFASGSHAEGSPWRILLRLCLQLRPFWYQCRLKLHRSAGVGLCGTGRV